MILSKFAAFVLLALGSQVRSQIVVENPINPGLPDGTLTNVFDDDGQAWGWMWLAALGISIIGLLMSFFILGMVHKARWQEYRLKKFVLLLFGFGIGGILGTTFVVILPRGYGQKVRKYTYQGNEEFTTLLISTEVESLIILAGFGWFFLWDLFIRHWLSKPHEKHAAGGSPHESIRVEEPPKTNVVPNVIVQPTNQVTLESGRGTGTNPLNPTGYTMVPHSDIIGNTNVVGQPDSYPQVAYGNPNVQAEHRGSTEISDRAKTFSLEGSRKQSILIIFRQMMYNFFSAAAVGTAMGTGSRVIALSVSLCILVQEIPLEIADTILLYYSGLSFKNSMLYNLLWNTIPVILGVVIGRALAIPSSRGIAYLFGAISGAFIYMAATNIMSAIVKERKGGMKIAYFIAVALGAGVMFALYQVEE